MCEIIAYANSNTSFYPKNQKIFKTCLIKKLCRNFTLSMVNCMYTTQSVKIELRILIAAIVDTIFVWQMKILGANWWWVFQKKKKNRKKIWDLKIFFFCKSNFTALNCVYYGTFTTFFICDFELREFIFYRTFVGHILCWTPKMLYIYF